jgi:hypothetical protein
MKDAEVTMQATMSESGHLSFRPASELRAKREGELRSWEAAKLSDAASGTNIALRAREQQIVEVNSRLKLGLTANDVVNLLGPPDRIHVPFMTEEEGGKFTVLDSKTIKLEELFAQTNASFFGYTPHPRGRFFNKPDDSFQTLVIGFDRQHRVFFWELKFDRPTVWVEYGTD